MGSLRLFYRPTRGDRIGCYTLSWGHRARPLLANKCCCLQLFSYILIVSK